MYEHIRVPPPPPPTGDSLQKYDTKYHYLFNLVMPLKRKAAVKSQQLPDPLARLSPVPSPVSCPVVSDDVQFKLQISNSVLTTRRNLLLHCWTHQYVTINPNFSAYVLQSIRLNGWFRGRVVNSWFWISYFLRSPLIWIYIVFKTGHYQAAW